MIVFNQGQYNFINYKDQVEPFKTLFGIKKIEKLEKPMPDVGNNCVVIYSSGEVHTAGAPYPGGIIYLQKDYVAINYSSDNVGFTVCVSNDYKYCDHYANIIPVRHQCTPLARGLKQTPSSFAFVKSGCLSMMADSHINGAQASFVAIEDGEVIGLFDVKAQHYPGLPMPLTSDLDQIITCANMLRKGTEGTFELGQPVTGLLKTPEIEGHITDLRSAVSQYKELSIDFDIASSFMMPASDADVVNGVVSSCLSKLIAKDYIKEQLESGQPVKDNISQVILDNDSILAFLQKDKFEDSLFDFINNDTFVESMVVVLTTEFQKILEHYNLIYLKTKEEVAHGALVSLKADLIQAGEILGNKATEYFREKSRTIIRSKKGFNNVDLSVDFRLFVKPTVLSELEAIDMTPTNDGSKAALFTETCERIVRGFSHGSVLRPGQDIDMKGKPPFINIKDLESFNLDNKIVATTIQKVDEYCDALARSIPDLPDVNLEYRVNMNKRSRLGDCALKSEWFITINPSAVKFNVIRATVINGETHARVQAIVPEFDSDVDSIAGGFANKMKDMLREHFQRMAGFKSFKYHCDSRDKFNRGWADIFRNYSQAKPYGGSPAQWRFEFDVVFACSKFTTINLKVDETDQTIKLATYVTSLIAQIAAQAAYDACKPMFEQLKENYEHQAIGFIGNGPDGIPCQISDLAYFAQVDEDYLNTLITLIDNIQDSYARNALLPFRNQISSAVAVWKTRKPIVYISKERVLSAAKVSDVNAISHYLYGGI